MTTMLVENIENSGRAPLLLAEPSPERVTGRLVVVAIALAGVVSALTYLGHLIA